MSGFVIGLILTVVLNYAINHNREKKDRFIPLIFSICFYCIFMAIAVYL
jgi:hypothetical protein